MMTIQMRSSKKTTSALCFLLVAASVAAMHAGGALETFDITGRVPSPIAGQVVARVIGMRWDTRALPVQYSVNITQDPIPNPLGAPFLSVADATVELQASLDAWNNIKTSFIAMRITGTTSNPGLRGFDFVNELTFRTAANFTAIASSPSVTLLEDTVLVDGDRVDNDADSDVSNLITVATDVDGDGDLEFPAGFYKAGTILDNDVQFNTKTTNGLRFTVGAAAVDTVTRSVDLGTVAVHEFGHSHGLSHSLNNQNSAADPNGATMFPFIDTGDPAAELAQRTLDADDIAYSSYFYPEGTAKKGPAALQSGDVAFDKVFGLIKGRLQHGVLNQPMSGGHVFTVNDDTGVASTGAFSGTTQLSYNPANGGLSIIDPAFNIVDGKFVIPVTRGKYRVGIEAVDGAPVPDTSISFTTQIGAIFGQQNFNEEFVDRSGRGRHGHHDGDDDGDDDSRETISVRPGDTEGGVDIVTSADVNIDNFGNRNFIGFTAQVPGRYYAVRITADQLKTIDAGRGLDFKAMAFDTAVVDASVAPIFAEATLATGSVNADGTVASINLDLPLSRRSMFLGQDNDFAPFFFRHGGLLGKVVRLGMRFGLIDDLFLVLRVPTTTPFPGVSAIPPLIGLDGGVAVNDVPIFNLSYISDDGGVTFNRVPNFNFRFSLRLAQAEDDDDHGHGDDHDHDGGKDRH